MDIGKSINMKNKDLKSSKCKNNLKFLEYLNSVSGNRRKKLLYYCSKGEIESIIEIFLNFLNNNISCKIKFIKSIKKYSKKFDKIIKKKTPISYKRKFLSNKIGGFLLDKIIRLALPILKNIFL